MDMIYYNTIFFFNELFLKDFWRNNFLCIQIYNLFLKKKKKTKNKIYNL